MSRGQNIKTVMKTNIDLPYYSLRRYSSSATIRTSTTAFVEVVGILITTLCEVDEGLK
jgi:hypothetical protein